MALSGWSTAAASNATVGSIDWAEGMAPAQVNNSARQMMADFATWYRGTPEWIDRAETATYVSGTSFKFVGSNKASIYSVGRRIKLVAATPGTIYGRITAVSTSASAGDTTVTVSWDSGSLSNEAITSVAPALVKGGTSAQSIYIGGLKGVSTFSSATIGSTTAAAWRTALGLGSLAVLSTINNSNWSGTALAVANGGTGSTSASAARTALGVTQASTSNTGIIKTTNATDIATGTSTGAAITPASLLSAIGFSKYFQSSAQTMSAAGTATIAHGIGRKPILVQCVCVCISATLNYSVNDEVYINPAGDASSSSNGMSLTIDSTNINIRYPNAALAIVNKTTGVEAALDVTKWRLYVRAWG